MMEFEELQKENAQLREENIKLRKRLESSQDALKIAVETAQGLSEQQAWHDPWYEKSLAKAKSALSHDKILDSLNAGILSITALDKIDTTCTPKWNDAIKKWYCVCDECMASSQEKRKSRKKS